MTPAPVCPLPWPRAVRLTGAEEGALRLESGVRAAPPPAQLLCVAVKRPSIGLFGQCRAVCLVVTGSKVGIVPRGRLLLPRAGRGPLTLTRAGRLRRAGRGLRAPRETCRARARALGLGDFGRAARVWAGVPPPRLSVCPQPRRQGARPAGRIDTRTGPGGGLLEGARPWSPPTVLQTVSADYWGYCFLNPAPSGLAVRRTVLHCKGPRDTSFKKMLITWA